MSNYAEFKKQIDAVRDKYGCKGEIIFRTAIQLLVDAGKCTILDSAWWRYEMDDIDARHDKAEVEGKFLFMTRDFEKAIYECAKDLCEIDTYDISTLNKKYSKIKSACDHKTGKVNRKELSSLLNEEELSSITIKVPSEYKDSLIAEIEALKEKYNIKKVN